MSEHTGTEFTEVDLTGARFRKVHLDGARFRMVDLSGAVLRDVSLAGASIDGSEIDGLRIDGVEVAPLIEAELTRRYPARAWHGATTPEDLRTAWAEVERSWQRTYERAAALPPAVLDASVEQEWSFTQTLRHLVFVTDAWLGAVRGDDHPFHPWGLPFTDLTEFIGRPVSSLGIDLDAAPSYPEVLELRADRVGRVRHVLAETTPQRLDEEVEGPVWHGERVAVRSCLRVILREEREHQRFADRDLAVLAPVV